MRMTMPRARDFTNGRCRWGRRIDDHFKAANRARFRVCSKVGHAVGVIKRVFGFPEVHQ